MSGCIFSGGAHEHHGHDHHDHHHDHDHGHHHDFRTADRKALRISLIITFLTMILEIVYGILSGSLALVSDAVHMFTHAFALGISYFAIVYACRKAPADKTFGYHRAEVIAAFINAITIGLSVIWILYEAYGRFVHPRALETQTIFVVAFIGLAVNIVTGLILMKGDMTNLNMRSAFAHMMADTVSSIAIVVGAAVIYYTGWVVIDTLIAVMVAFVIGRWSYTLLKGSVNVLMESSPVDVNDVTAFITDNYAEIEDVHDLHLWEVAHNMYCITAHLSVNCGNGDFCGLIDRLTEDLHEKFSIGHATFQPEWVRPQS